MLLPYDKGIQKAVVFQCDLIINLLDKLSQSLAYPKNTTYNYDYTNVIMVYMLFHDCFRKYLLIS